MSDTTTPYATPIPESAKSLDMPVTWRATDEHFRRRLITPDGNAEFVYFAFMIAIKPPLSDQEWAGLRPAIEPTVQNEVSILGEHDRSAVPCGSQNYRPSGRFGSSSCILGAENWTSRQLKWLLVDFSRVINLAGLTNIVVSYTWWWDGRPHTLKQEWGPPAKLDFDGRYRVVIHYTDAGRDWGVGMFFDPVAML